MSPLADFSASDRRKISLNLFSIFVRFDCCAPKIELTHCTLVHPHRQNTGRPPSKKMKRRKIPPLEESDDDCEVILPVRTDSKVLARTCVTELEGSYLSSYRLSSVHLHNL
jgi:hypothetical protein